MNKNVIDYSMYLQLFKSNYKKGFLNFKSLLNSVSLATGWANCYEGIIASILYFDTYEDDFKNYYINESADSIKDAVCNTLLKEWFGTRTPLEYIEDPEVVDFINSKNYDWLFAYSPVYSILIAQVLAGLTAKYTDINKLIKDEDYVKNILISQNCISFFLDSYIMDQVFRSVDNFTNLKNSIATTASLYETIYGNSPYYKLAYNRLNEVNWFIDIYNGNTSIQNYAISKSSLVSGNDSVIGKGFLLKYYMNSYYGNINYVTIYVDNIFINGAASADGTTIKTSSEIRAVNEKIALTNPNTAMCTTQAYYVFI